MTHFVGLDVSQKMTAICVVDNVGRRDPHSFYCVPSPSRGIPFTVCQALERYPVKLVHIRRLGSSFGIHAVGTG
jgi:hypothetical protein